MSERPPYYTLLDAMLFLTLLLVSVVCILWITDHRGSTLLPKCQRNEYLYPVDYKGPGKNRPSEYRCRAFPNVEAP